MHAHQEFLEMLYLEMCGLAPQSQADQVTYPQQHDITCFSVYI